MVGQVGDDDVGRGYQLGEEGQEQHLPELSHQHVVDFLEELGEFQHGCQVEVHIDLAQLALPRLGKTAQSGQVGRREQQEAKSLEMQLVELAREALGLQAVDVHHYYTLIMLWRQKRDGKNCYMIRKHDRLL